MVAPADELNSFLMYPIVLIVNMATEWKSILVLWYILFFPKALQIFIGAVENSVFQLIVYDHFCMLYTIMSSVHFMT